MIEVVVLNEKGKIELTKKELEDMLERARQEGFCQGKQDNHTWITPTTPTIGQDIVLLRNNLDTITTATNI